MNLETRIDIEKQIAKKTIEVLLAASYRLMVNDWEEDVTDVIDNADELFKAMFTTDGDYLLVFNATDEEHRIGWIQFVYGNDGYDVICDYTTNLEDILQPVFKLADELEEKHA